MSEGDLQSLWLTLRLAGLVTALLLLVATPLAWWLAHSRTHLVPVIEALTALPLVLPPTVIGFYMLVAFAPSAVVGGFWLRLTGHSLGFSFTGLVVASLFYSLPFAVQPLQAGFVQMGRAPMEAAASVGAAPWDAFLSVALPLSLRAYLTAGVLTFAHTMGEFGVVLMVGGNIPGQTRVISVALYEEVEGLNYGAAHRLAALLMALSFAVLLGLYTLNAQARRGQRR